MQSDTRARETIKRIGLVAGPVLAGICYVSLPTSYASGEEIVEFGSRGRATTAVMIWMATWWLTEAIHISATALLPLVLLPTFAIATIREAAAPYADPMIFLFLGGFLLALSMQRWGLGKRIALLMLRLVGPNPVRLVAGFMFVTAVFSAFVSNTATAAMMLPIATSVIGLIESRRAKQADADVLGQDDDGAGENFGASLLLGIAYSASVGGVATIIGSPPNAVLVGFIGEQIAEPYRADISMAQWLLIGGPLSLMFLPVVLFVLTKLLFPARVDQIEGARELIDKEIGELGPPSRGEWATFIVFVCTATLWVARPWLVEIEKHVGSTGFSAFSELKDAGIAILAGLVLFVIPVDSKKGQFVMDWKTAEQLPWGILILFGGGLSLAAAVQSSGVAEFIGHQARFLTGLHPMILVLAICSGMVLLTELTSNTAATASLVPVLAAIAAGLGVHPYLLVFPATLAASFAFMLPVATPPNAIIFGSGRVTMAQMVKAGIWLNAIGILLATTATALLVGPVLGIDIWD